MQTNLTARIEAATGAETIATALTEYDAVVAACPANIRSLGGKRCPKCGAGSSEGCGRQMWASYQFIEIVRRVIALKARNNGGE